MSAEQTNETTRLDELEKRVEILESQISILARQLGEVLAVLSQLTYGSDDSSIIG